MRVLLAVLLAAGTISADVVVLKDGRKFGGKVVEKGAHYEVTTEAGLKTFLKDEVEKIITSPAEMLGDTDKLIEEAKKEYQEAVVISDLNAAQPRFKAALAKVTQARVTILATRELFWEDKYSDLDQKLLQVMQLTRMLRERVGSEIARRPEAPTPKEAPPPPPPPAVSAIDDAFATLLDPAKRNDASRRAQARDAFSAARKERGDVVAAAAIFLSRSDADWKLEKEALAAVQEYFAKYLKEHAKLNATVHLDAALVLSGKVAALKGAAPSEALSLFGMAHLGHATPGEPAEKAAQSLGLVAKEGQVGTLEGHAVRDLNQWINTGNYDLAPVAYLREYRGTVADTSLVRFLWAYAMLRHAQNRKRGFERAAGAFDSVKPMEAPFRDHAAAMAKSVRNVGVCGLCAGEAKVRCTNCHGKKEAREDCKTCNGAGAVNSGGGVTNCTPCRGRGFTKLLKCTRCKDGFPACTRCDAKPRTPPEMEDLCLETRCGICDGKGLAFSKVLWPCRSCIGLGMRLTPRADPNKVLPH